MYKEPKINKNVFASVLSKISLDLWKTKAIIVNILKITINMVPYKVNLLEISFEWLILEMWTSPYRQIFLHVQKLK